MMHWGGAPGRGEERDRGLWGLLWDLWGGRGGGGSGYCSDSRNMIGLRCLPLTGRQVQVVRPKKIRVAVSVAGGGGAFGNPTYIEKQVGTRTPSPVWPRPRCPLSPRHGGWRRGAPGDCSRSTICRRCARGEGV